MAKRKIMAALLSAAMAITLMAPAVHAAPVASNTNVAGKNVYFDKYLVMKQQANVPNATFTFTIEPGAAHAATANTPQIYAGIGTPTVGTAAFTPNDTTYTTPQTFVSATGATTDTVQTATVPTTDEVELKTGEKYARKRVLVNFSGVTYTTPGIYRYVVTETDPTSMQGIDEVDPAANNNMLYLDVYVNSDAAGVLSIAGSVLHRVDEIAANSIDAAQTYDGGFGTDPTHTKPTGFTNHYQTQDISLQKSVTGNQGDRSKYFQFTVNIANAIPGTVYDVDLTDAEATPTVEGTARTNSARLTAGQDGTLSATYWLRHDQKIKIKGLAEDTTYAISEVISDDLGYAVSHVTTTTVDGQTPVAGSSVTGKDISATQISNMDQDVVYTNYRNGVVPTGILLSSAPYIALVAFAALALIIVAAKKRKGAVSL